jgi:4-hydroxy-tetrahydrodipicolinate reductase
VSNEIRVVITGVAGKMGKETAKAVLNGAPGLRLVGAVDPREAGVDLGEIIGVPGCEVKVSEHLGEVFASTKADVLVDFTNPQAVLHNAKTALENGTAPVIGTTGLDVVGLAELEKLAARSDKAVLIVPNFALGAVLMMDFARRAARYFKNVEIIEMHHDQKIDAPSGTAIKTAQMIQQQRESMRQGHPDEYEKLTGARGGEWEGIRIHSVRLPGLVAHQEVIFGLSGETLTIRHDSLHRESFMPGVIMAIRRIGDLKGVVVGLEKILD